MNNFGVGSLAQEKLWVFFYFSPNASLTYAELDQGLEVC